MWMSTNLWILLGIIAFFTIPILIWVLSDYFGWNTNKFYGDVANKNKLSLRDKTYQKSDKYWNVAQKDQHFHGGGNGDSGGPQ